MLKYLKLRRFGPALHRDKSILEFEQGIPSLSNLELYTHSSSSFFKISKYRGGLFCCLLVTQCYMRVTNNKQWIKKQEICPLPLKETKLQSIKSKKASVLCWTWWGRQLANRLPFASAVSVCARRQRLIAGHICTSVIENPMSNDSHVTSFVKYSWFLWITFRQPRTLTFDLK